MVLSCAGGTVLISFIGQTLLSTEQFGILFYKETVTEREAHSKFPQRRMSDEGKNGNQI